MRKQMVSTTDDGERIWKIYVVFAVDKTMASKEGSGWQTEVDTGIIYRRSQAL
jgi:hypothetical protein